MHRLIKIRIIRDLEFLEEEVHRCLDTWFAPLPTCLSYQPAADFYEIATGLMLRLELPGVRLEDLSLALAGQELVVRGRRNPPPPNGVRRFIHLETKCGAFERRFFLPIAIDVDQVQARLVDGILEIQLPRKAPVTRQIQVTEDPQNN